MCSKQACEIIPKNLLVGSVVSVGGRAGFHHIYVTLGSIPIPTDRRPKVTPNQHVNTVHSTFRGLPRSHTVYGGQARSVAVAV